MAARQEKLRRTQISLSEEDLQAVRGLARRRRTSMSGVIRSAIRREMERESTLADSLMGIVGIGESTGDSTSANPDDQVYG